MKAWIMKNANENHDKKTDKSISHRHRILSLMTSATIASQSIVLLNSSPVMAEGSPSNLLVGYKDRCSR